MKNALAGVLADIHSDIEPGHGRVELQDFPLHPTKQVVATLEFRPVEIEVRGHVPPGDDEGMQFGDGIPVADGVGQPVISNHAAFWNIAEKAVRMTCFVHGWVAGFLEILFRLFRASIERTQAKDARFRSLAEREGFEPSIRV